MLNDKRYLDSILESIQDRENISEVGPIGIAITIIMGYWLAQSVYKSIRIVSDKHYRACIKKGQSKKCRLQSKIFMAEKGLMYMGKVGPSKCKTKKDPAKCMNKLKTDKVKLQKQLQYFKAQLSVK